MIAFLITYLVFGGAVNIDANVLNGLLTVDTISMGVIGFVLPFALRAIKVDEIITAAEKINKIKVASDKPTKEELMIKSILNRVISKYLNYGLQLLR